MELIKTDIQPARRAIKREPTFETGIAAVTAMEEELNHLQVLFSAASFILAEHKVRALSHLCRLHAQLKSEVANYLQKMKQNSAENRNLMLKSQLSLNASLQNQILNLKARIQSFRSTLFRKPVAKRHLL
jgi:hypothetical protein